MIKEQTPIAVKTIPAELHRRILDLTPVSNGTLLTCCRQSSTLNTISPSWDSLNKVRQDWRNFLFSSTKEKLAQLRCWQDAWNYYAAYRQQALRN